MKAIIYKRYGTAGELELVDLPKPALRAHEVLIEVHASSVNPIDWKLRRGDLKVLMPLRMPVVPGFDLSGKIVEVGASVKNYAVGDDVYARSSIRQGRASAQFIALDPICIAKKPTVMNHKEAASVPLAALTALQALRDKGSLQSGQKVLVNGASGGVGIFAIQIAKALGAHVTGVCSGKNVDLVKKLGADVVIDYNSQSPLAGDNIYNVVFDTVASLRYANVSKKLVKKGVYISTVPKVTRILKYTVGNMVLSKKEVFIMMKPSGADLKLLADLANEGNLQTIIDSEFMLSDMEAAHKLSESGRVRGKIIINMKD